MQWYELYESLQGNPLEFVDYWPKVIVVSEDVYIKSKLSSSKVVKTVFHFKCLVYQILVKVCTVWGSGDEEASEVRCPLHLFLRSFTVGKASLFIECISYTNAIQRDLCEWKEHPEWNSKCSNKKRLEYYKYNFIKNGIFLNEYIKKIYSPILMLWVR